MITALFVSAIAASAASAQLRQVSSVAITKPAVAHIDEDNGLLHVTTFSRPEPGSPSTVPATCEDTLGSSPFLQPLCANVGICTCDDLTSQFECGGVVNLPGAPDTAPPLVVNFWCAKTCEACEPASVPTGPPAGPPAGPDDSITLLRDLDQIFDEDITPDPSDLHKVATDAVWPNLAKPVDPTKLDLPSETELFITANGFFVANMFSPYQGTGDVAIYSRGANDEFVKHVLSTKDGYFYHKVKFAYCDEDNRLDIVTARAKVPFGDRGPNFAEADTELLCLIQPQADPLAQDSWHELILFKNGPGTSFELVNLDHDQVYDPSLHGGNFQIVGANFWTGFKGPEEVNEGLRLYTCASHRWANCDPTTTNELVVSNRGKFFSVHAADLNADGKLDFFGSVSPHAEPFDGGLFAYEQPRNPFEPVIDADGHEVGWFEHVLVDNSNEVDGQSNLFWFPSDASGTGSPGEVQTFKPTPTKRKGCFFGICVYSADYKPSIIVSGDDAGFFLILHPTHPFSHRLPWQPDWSYTVEKIPIDNGAPKEGTVGSPAVGDVNGDGYADLVLPDYHRDVIEFWTYAPGN